MSEQTVEVTTPNPRFTGTRAGVDFVSGTATCTPEQARILAARFGYQAFIPEPQPVKQRRTRKAASRGN